MQNDNIALTVDAEGNFHKKDGDIVGTIGSGTLLKSLENNGTTVKLAFHQASQYHVGDFEHFPIGAVFTMIFKDAYIEASPINDADDNIMYMDSVYSLYLKDKTDNEGRKSLEFTDDNKAIWVLFYKEMQITASLPDHEVETRVGTTFIEHSALDIDRIRTLIAFAEQNELENEAKILQSLIENGHASSDTLADLQYTLRDKLEELSENSTNKQVLREIERNIDHLAIRLAE